MKIQCDVCNKDEASVFCSADEAALCNACDHRVHHANKLASKHQRFSLLLPSPKQFPLCDICQEKRAFLFCQQDRAILCRDCDVPIHKANEHTKKHNRFLLTGVKLSATSDLYVPTTKDSVANGCDSSSVSDRTKSQPSTNKSVVSVSSQIYHPPSIEIEKTSSTTTTTANKDDVGSTSSISEYLIETLPGWHVEDFLDSSSAPFGFCKTDDGAFHDVDFGSNLSSFSSENMGFWVPQAPSTTTTTQAASQLYSTSSTFINGYIGLFKESTTKEAAGTNLKSSSRTWSDDGFTVPQISPPSIGSKRSRHLW